MQLGMVGLGRMGGSMAIRLTKAGQDCVVYDSHHEAVDALVKQGTKGATDLPGFDVTRNLARHGISAELKTLPRGDDVGALILSYAADENADLLVMGGYGHSRLREFVLGGATRTILASMTLPVFMAH